MQLPIISQNICQVILLCLFDYSARMQQSQVLSVEDSLIVMHYNSFFAFSKKERKRKA
jgi:hypothetical protein